MAETPKKLILTPAAQRDLDGIWDYTAEVWSPAQAEKYLIGVQERFANICISPNISRERQEFDPPVRIYPYRSHLIIYRATFETISILRVVHARQNWQAFIEGGA